VTLGPSDLVTLGPSDLVTLGPSDLKPPDPDPVHDGNMMRQIIAGSYLYPFFKEFLMPQYKFLLFIRFFFIFMTVS